MGRFIVIRFIQSIVALMGISLLIFVLVRASGDPTMLMRTSTTTEEDIALIKEQLGLDKSQPEQFLIFAKNLAHFDLGNSLIKRKPVTTMIGESLPNTLRLIVPAFFCGMLVSLILGVLSATRRDSLLDNIVKFIAILGQALPSFWLAILFIFLFSVHWPLLPAAGTGPLPHYVMPVFILAFFLLPGMMRLVRSSMLDVLDSEYVTLARIKGVRERVIIWRHALRNALIPVVTYLGLKMASFMNGSVVVETVFAWPGVGRLAVEAVMSRDYPVVQGVVIMVCVFLIIINLIVDLVYMLINPQIRHGMK